jgi:hypothetical protein
MLREAAPVYVEEGLVDDEVPVAPATPEGWAEPEAPATPDG